MGTINVNGGGAQVVQYVTKAGKCSKRLAYNESADLEVNDSGDQVWLKFCFLSCGDPCQGPADVLPGDRADADAMLYRGIRLIVVRNEKVIYDETGWTPAKDPPACR